MAGRHVGEQETFPVTNVCLEPQLTWDILQRQADKILIEIGDDRSTEDRDMQDAVWQSNGLPDGISRAFCLQRTNENRQQHYYLYINEELVTNYGADQLFMYLNSAPLRSPVRLSLAEKRAFGETAVYIAAEDPEVINYFLTKEVITPQSVPGLSYYTLLNRVQAEYDLSGEMTRLAFDITQETIRLTSIGSTNTQARHAK